jgi:hypothetical protein
VGSIHGQIAGCATETQSHYKYRLWRSKSRVRDGFCRFSKLETAFEICENPLVTIIRSHCSPEHRMPPDVRLTVNPGSRALRGGHIRGGIKRSGSFNL